MVVADGENTSKYTDQMLVQRIRQGEDAAFSILVRRYQHKVFGIVHRMLGIPEESEDLAQEVFVTFYRSVDHYRG
ncbi:MAG: sigma factor, partial [Myxococcota bacterium]